MIYMKYKQIYGNVLAKVICDGVALENHKSFQYLALLLIDFFWKNYLVVCCGFAYLNTKKDPGIAYLLKKSFKFITRNHLTDIMGIMVVDR